IIELIAFKEVEQKLWMTRVNGVACFYEAVGPGFVTRELQLEKKKIALTFEEFRMVAIRIVCRAVNPKTFVPAIVVLVGLAAFPVGSAFYAKVVVGLTGQTAVAIARFQNALGQGNACGNARSLHFFDGQAAIQANVFFGIRRARRRAGITAGGIPVASTAAGAIAVLIPISGIYPVWLITRCVS